MKVQVKPDIGLFAISIEILTANMASTPDTLLLCADLSSTSTDSHLEKRKWHSQNFIPGFFWVPLLWFSTLHFWKNLPEWEWTPARMNNIMSDPRPVLIGGEEVYVCRPINILVCGWTTSLSGQLWNKNSLKIPVHV